MFTELLSLRQEEFSTPQDFKLIRPQKQTQFNEVMQSVLYDSLPIVLPQDDDCDGYVSVVEFREFIEMINPNKEVIVYIPPKKSHGVDSNFVEYVKLKYPSGCHIIVTDSSTDCVDTLAELSKFGKLIHIDHHMSETEDKLNQICSYHANCRYEENENLHNLSAGFYSYLHLACFCMEKAKLPPDFLERQFTLGTLSLISDICTLKTPYNRSILKQYMKSLNQHELLQCFSDNYTRYNAYFLAFKVAPKINMLFRLRLVKYLEKLHAVNSLQPLIDAINGIYRNYKFVVEQSIGYLEVKDYDKFITVDISHIDKLYPMFNGYASNFTGWYSNKLSQMFLKPCITTCLVSDSQIKGSARDITEQNVYDILNELDFLTGGGHPNAYGFTCDVSTLQDLNAYFYYGLDGKIDITTDSLPVSSLHELDAIARVGELMQFAEYNDYTINDKIGFVYRIKYSDVIENYPNRSVIKHPNFKIVSFDPELKAGDLIKLIPDNQLNKIQLIANIVERGA